MNPRKAGAELQEAVPAASSTTPHRARTIAGHTHFRKTENMRVAELLLRGAGGEPVDFARTIVSHGVAELPPNRVELAARTLETTLPVPRGARTVSITASARRLHVEAVAGTVGAQAREALTKTVAHMFRLDEDLSRFYTLVGEKGDLSWCAAGAGRMLRAPTVFEDVVKTI